MNGSFLFLVQLMPIVKCFSRFTYVLEDIEDAVRNLEIENDGANVVDEPSIPQEDGKEDNLNEEIDCKRKGDAISDHDNVEDIESKEENNQLTPEGITFVKYLSYVVFQQLLCLCF